MASPNNYLRIRDKDATISKIDIPKEKMEVLQKIVSSHKISSYVKSTIMKELCDGSCCLCGSVPTQLATYQLEGATLIERYCDKCIKSVYAREQVI